MRSCFNTVVFPQNAHIFGEFKVCPIICSTSTFIAIMLYALSCYIGPRYNWTRQHQGRWSYGHGYYMNINEYLIWFWFPPPSCQFMANHALWWLTIKSGLGCRTAYALARMLILIFPELRGKCVNKQSFTTIHISWHFLHDRVSRWITTN